MTIHQFLDAVPNVQCKKSVVCFAGESYPLLFFSQLFQSIKKHQPLIVPTQEETGPLFAQLSTSFLGQKSWYWLKSFDEFSKANQQAWFAYLYSYTGPNTIFFYSSTLPRPIPESWEIIKISPFADTQLIKSILNRTGKTHMHTASFIKKLALFCDQVPLDTAVVLIQYALVVGADHEQFFSSWMPLLIKPTSSLFALSQAFFAKQSRKLFTQLKGVEQLYVPQFWLSFWSEQLWRASNYITLMRAHKRAEAKRISYRLPFSFLNRDWRQFTPEELQDAHHFLYDLDYSLKNGGSPVFLDLFYSKFVTNYFVSRSG